MQITWYVSQALVPLSLPHWSMTDATDRRVSTTRGMHDIVGWAWVNTHTEQEQLHAREHYQNVTETSGHRVWYKMYKHMYNTRIVNSEVYTHFALAHPVPSLQLVWQCHTHHYHMHFWLVSPDSGAGSWQLSLWMLYTRLSPPDFMEEGAWDRGHTVCNHFKIGMGQRCSC